LIAEGIEQPEELEALVDLGVNYGQGFLPGRPAGRIKGSA
jgi:EAL domain-containing protein (putative c-di-GMP-specific phosphodiesterase class I)